MARLTLVLLVAMLVALAGSVAAGTMGGYRDEKVDDAHVQQAARAVADHYNRVHNSDKRFIVTAVHKARKQVVAGFKYDLQLDLSRSANCLNDGTPTAADDGCQPDADTPATKLVHAVVLWQAWVTPPMTVLDLTIED